MIKPISLILLLSLVSFNLSAATIYFDLADSYIVDGNWNTVAAWGEGVHINNAIDSEGGSTNVSYNCTDGFAMNNSGGETAVSAYPAAAGRDSFYLSTVNNYAQIMIGGLTAGSSYDFKFFGSRSSIGPRAIDISIGAQSVYHDSAYNKSTVAEINNVQTGQSGIVVINVRLASNSSYGYLGVIEINGDFDPPQQQPDGLFVAPWGLDSNPGTYAWPKGSMQGACDAVDQYKQSYGLPNDGLNVYFRSGRYYFSSAANASASVSGEPDKLVTFKPYNGESVVFDGSSPLNGSNFSLVTDQAVLDRLGEGAAGNVYQCYISNTLLRERLSNASTVLDLDGKMAQVTRYPNLGFNHIGTVIDPGEFYISGRTPGDPPEYSMDEPIGAELTIAENDAARWAKWQQEYDIVKKAKLKGYLAYDWYEDSHTIADIANEAVKLLEYSRYEIHSNGIRRLFVLNLMCELDCPGEWYFDQLTNMLYVYPYQPITAQSNLGVWNAPEFVKIYCSNVRFEDFTIQGTSSGTGMIVFYDGDNTVFSGCTIRNTTRTAVSFPSTTAATNSGIIGCNVYDSPSHLSLNGGILNPNQITGAGNFAINCQFMQMQSKDFKSRYHLTVRGVGNIFRNNLIHNLPADALSPGGNDNIIELNEVFNCGFETGDGGSMYWTNAMWSYGNIFRHNFVHHIMCTPGLHSRGGMYPDQLDAGDTFIENVFYKAAHRAILINGGAAHKVERNVFLEGYIGIYQTEGNAQDAYDKIPLYEDGTLLRGDTGDYIWRTEQVVGVEGWNNEPWISKYPTFALVMNQEKMRFWPIETYFTDNLFYGNSKSNFQYRYSGWTESGVTYDIDSTPDYIHKSGNRDITIDLFEDPSSLNFKFNADAPEWAPDIPFENIGLYIGDGRKIMPNKNAYRKTIKQIFSDRESFDENAVYDPATINDLIYVNTAEILNNLNLPTDFNNDGITELSDFALLANEWRVDSTKTQPESLLDDSFESYSPTGTVSPVTGNINTAGGIANGWYGSNFGSNNRVTLVGDKNSPWDAVGSQSAAIVRTSTTDSRSDLYNYFSDQSDKYNYPENVNVTGSAGGALVGDGIAFSFDALVPDFSRQPKWEIRDASNSVAIEFQVRYNSKNLRYSDGTEAIEISDFVFSNDVWYRFEIGDVDVTNGKWSLDVYESGTAEAVISLADLSFANSVASLGHFRMYSNSTANHTFYLDNFKIESKTEQTSSPQTYVSDLNFDGIVDVDDLIIFISYWLESSI